MLIFNKVKQRLGGNVRLIITASAPIAENILNFLKVLFCCPIVEAYGQTESCGASFATKVFDNKAGHVGGPTVANEFKLAELPDMGYTSRAANPKGEVCLRGPCVFEGYFRNKELTDQVKDAQGWLHTGDVGQLGPGGALKIIDRIKNIFKLSQVSI
jgi:long-chain acyl-CoA synthetase